MRLRNASAAAALVVFLAACGGDSDPEAAPETDGETATEGETPEGETDGETDDEAGAGDPAEQPDLPNPDEFITDNVFRGQGVVLPIPDGWSVNELALVQGLVAAIDDEDPNQQFQAQALDTDALAEGIEFDELLESQRGQFGDAEPTIDESVEIEGADQAHRLRFEDVQVTPPAGQPEQPPLSLDLIVAGTEGRIAQFNYVAPPEDFDESTADLLVEGAGIDPDSAPPAPPAGPAPAPGGEGAGGEGAGGDEPIPAEPDEGIGDGAGPPDAEDQDADAQG